MVCGISKSIPGHWIWYWYNSRESGFIIAAAAVVSFFFLFPLFLKFVWKVEKQRKTIRKRKRKKETETEWQCEWPPICLLLKCPQQIGLSQSQSQELGTQPRPPRREAGTPVEPSPLPPTQCTSAGSWNQEHSRDSSPHLKSSLFFKKI